MKKDDHKPWLLQPHRARLSIPWPPPGRYPSSWAFTADVVLAETPLSSPSCPNPPVPLLQPRDTAPAQLVRLQHAPLVLYHISPFIILTLLSKGALVRLLLVPTLGLYPLAVSDITRASFLRLTTSPSPLVPELPSAHTPGRGQAANCGFGKHAAQHPIPGSPAFRYRFHFVCRAKRARFSPRCLLSERSFYSCFLPS